MQIVIVKFYFTCVSRSNSPEVSTCELELIFVGDGSYPDGTAVAPEAEVCIRIKNNYYFDEVHTYSIQYTIHVQYCDLSLWPDGPMLAGYTADWHMA